MDSEYIVNDKDSESVKKISPEYMYISNDDKSESLETPNFTRLDNKNKW